MPRTKQKRVKFPVDLGYQPFLHDFNRLMELKVQKMEVDFKTEIESYNMSFKLALNRYPPEIQNMTLHDLLTLDLSPKKENLPPKTPKATKGSKKSMKVPKSSKPKRSTTVSDDGYLSESQLSQVSKLTSTTISRSRSSSQSKTKRKTRSILQNRKSKLNNTKNIQKSTTKDFLETPNSVISSTFVITPKIKMNSVLNVLRKPKNGEMVFSAQGSPLLVSTTLNQRTAKVEIPVKDDKVISVLPFHETSLSENVYIDEETREQLKVIHNHLAKMLK